MVPTPVIKHFLLDLEDGKHDGFPRDGVIIQSMENVDLRDKYRLKNNQSGVLVAYISPESPALDQLQIGDVLLEIDGYKIANDGTIEFRPNERTSANFITQMHQSDDNLWYKILRNGIEKRIEHKSGSGSVLDELVLRPQYDVRPSYYIYGGLVFTPLSKNYLKTWGDEWNVKAPINLLHLYRHELPKFKGEQAIVLAMVLSSKLNEGYQAYTQTRFIEVNGKRFRNLTELIELVEAADGRFITFKNVIGGQIVFDRKKVESTQQEILDTYRVPSNQSN